jgi:hypothetical protein
VLLNHVQVPEEFLEEAETAAIANAALEEIGSG